MASAAVQDNFQSRDDQKKQKQLQEARQAGTAAPEMDEATGQMINPHNPSFITTAPWYLNQDKPSLKHHQAWNRKALGTKDWYKRGTKNDVKTKFIKGACENCGATTHTKKDCVERPRQVGAKHNGKNLMPDEHVEDMKFDWDGKRDRWNGWQPEDYKAVQEEWERVENERRNRKAADMEERAKLREQLKAQKKVLKQKRKQRRRQLRRQAEGKDSDTDADSDTGDSDTDSDTDSDSDVSDDEDLGEKMKDFDKAKKDVAGKDDRLRTTTRNLRIREDTAKYLLNLDVNSAYYDPKSRSMRQDPLAHLKDEEKGAFRGDNFLRVSGDAKQLTELTVFAWDAYKHGEKVHDTAQPTQAEKMHQVFKQRSKDLKSQQKTELMEKYGGQEHMDAPKELIYGQTEQYVEYSRDGRVLQGRERALVQSKYQEDVMVGNHSSVWGSWFDPVSKTWGFACCQQTMKNAYCIPLKTRVVEEQEAAAGETDIAAAPSAPAASSGGGGTATPIAGQQAGAASSASGSSSSSEDEDEEGDQPKKTLEERKQAIAEKRRARALAGLQIGDGSNKSGEGQQPAAGASSSTAAASSSSAPAPPAASAASDSKLSDKRSSAFGHVLEDVTDFDAQKVTEAVAREKKRRKEEKRAAAAAVSIDDERNRKYNSFGADSKVDVSPEEYEAYRLTRSRSDDPMAKFL